MKTQEYYPSRSQNVSGKINSRGVTFKDNRPSQAKMSQIIQRTQNSQTIQRIPTALELQQARANLRPADFGVVHPNLQHIRTRRNAGQSAAEYYDHMVDTRRSINRLMSQPVGRAMLTQIEARAAHIPLNGGLNPPTIVDIHSGNAMMHTPRFDGTNLQRGYRFGGIAGPGHASTIYYNANALSANRIISLGHEIVHAWRTAHGQSVAPPQISPRQLDPLLHRADDPNHIIRQAVDMHALQQEEFETVGLTPTPRQPNAPTENAIRAEHNRPARLDYSGVQPGNMNVAIAHLDDAVSNRFLGIRYNRHRVSHLVNYLEG